MELCEVRAAAQELEPNLLAWRRHLHRRPELSFQERETAAYIAAELAAMPGVTVTRPTATSVVGTIEGHGPGPTVALRADIDGLPVREETGLGFASERDGLMHACGHEATPRCCSAPLRCSRRSAAASPGRCGSSSSTPRSPCRAAPRNSSRTG